MLVHCEALFDKGLDLVLQDGVIITGLFTQHEHDHVRFMLLESVASYHEVAEQIAKQVVYLND